jgi:hypothetical protein
MNKRILKEIAIILMYLMIIIAILISGIVWFLWIPDKPKANLHYKSLTIEEASFFELIFYSDLDLLNVFERKYGVHGISVNCPMEPDEQLLIKHRNEGRPNGYVMNFSSYSDNKPILKENKGYQYHVSGGSFIRNLPDGNSENIASDKIRSLLLGQKSISCRAVLLVPYHFGNHYVSNPMEIPVTDILKAIDEYEEKQNTLVGVEEGEL